MQNADIPCVRGSTRSCLDRICRSRAFATFKSKQAEMAVLKLMASGDLGSSDASVEAVDGSGTSKLLSGISFIILYTTK